MPDISKATVYRHVGLLAEAGILEVDGADSVGYRQHALWLSRDELAEMIQEMRSVIVPRMRNEPAPDRAQYLLSPVLFPIGPGIDEPRSDGELHSDRERR